MGKIERLEFDKKNQILWVFNENYEIYPFILDENTKEWREIEESKQQVDYYYRKGFCTPGSSIIKDIADRMLEIKNNNIWYNETVNRKQVEIYVYIEVMVERFVDKI